MRRDGESLGIMQWETKHISLMQSGKMDLTQGEIQKMRNGGYVKRIHNK